MAQIKIKATLAYIRKCYGFVVELLTEEETKKAQFELIKKLKEEGEYHVYPLRHSDSDWSRPFSILCTNALVNRWGWFITLDEMDFSKNNEVDLNSRNAKYYGFKYDKKTDTTSIMAESTYPADEFDVDAFFTHKASILEAFQLFVSRSNEAAGIMLPEISDYRNGSRSIGRGLCVSFTSHDAKPDYFPNFKGLYFIGLDELPSGFESYDHVNMIMARLKTEIVHDIFIFEGSMEEHPEMKKQIEEEYDIINSGIVLLEEDSEDVFNALDTDEFKYANVDCEDFRFSVLKRYNKKFPLDRIITKPVSGLRVTSTKTSYDTNSHADLFEFYKVCTEE